MNQTPNQRPSDDEVLYWLSQDHRPALDWASLDDEQLEAEAAATLHALASTEFQALPADVEQRLLAAATAMATPAVPASVSAPAPAKTGWWRHLGLAWGTASFATVAAAVLALRLATLPMAERPPPASALKQAMHVPLQPGPDLAGEKVQGEVLWDASRGGGYVKLAGLPVNDPKREQYQLWIFDGTRDERYPVDGGVFNVRPDGEVELWIRVPIPVRKAALFAVTVEKAGGTVVSDRGRIVAIGKVGT